jgi:hypothetical protein
VLDGSTPRGHAESEGVFRGAVPVPYVRLCVRFPGAEWPRGPTVKSLEGSDIETYANQLFRFWKLGEAQKNNGVLLLVAPIEHKVRIEVGYGLEGTLTDALCSARSKASAVRRRGARAVSRNAIAVSFGEWPRSHEQNGHAASAATDAVCAGVQ